MQYIRKYWKQIFNLQTTNLDFLQENIKNNPKGLFFSFFETFDSNITLQQNFGQKVKIKYKSYHLFFGNDVENIGYILTTDLSHAYHNIAHHYRTVKFNELPSKIQKKIIIYYDKIPELKKMSEAIDCVLQKAVKQTPHFIIPENKSYYERLVVIFFKNKMDLNFSEKAEKTKSSKI